MRAGCALLAAALLSGSAAAADALRETVKARARERSAALDQASRAGYVALVMRVFDGWTDPHAYTEPELVGFEIAEAALRRIEKDRADAARDDAAYRTALLSALDEGLLSVSADEIRLSDPSRAANFFWRSLGARLSEGLSEGSIRAILVPGRHRASGYRALDPSGRALLSRVLDPAPSAPPLPTEAAVLSEVDWRKCVDAGRLRPRLLERYAERARSSDLEASAATAYAGCMSDRVIAALAEQSRPPGPRFPPVEALDAACRQPAR